MEYYQILTQISFFVFGFAIGAVVEYFNLKYNQIVYRTYEKLVIKMNNRDIKNNILYLILILLVIVGFLGLFIPMSYNFLNFALTAILVMVTYTYTHLTGDLVSETTKMRKAQTQPNVYVSVESKDELSHFIELFVQNIGLGPARDIKFEVSEFQYSANKLLSDVYLIKNGIEYLAPNQKIRVFIMQSYEVFELNSKDLVNIKINYTDIVGENFESKYQIDFMIIKDVQRIKDRYTSFESELINKAKEINNSLSNLDKISKHVETIAGNSIDSTGIMQSDSSKFLIITEDYDAKVEIAKDLVKRVLLRLHYELKTYNQSNIRIADSTLQVYSINFLDIAVSVTGLLPEKLIEDLLALMSEITILSTKKIQSEEYLKQLEGIKGKISFMYPGFGRLT